jgi:hypothetical protein
MYERAAELGWPSLSDAERTNQYRYWTDDQQIGGKLLLYLGRPEAVRVWMKDGPMKEYARAVNGIGKYADLVDEDIVRLPELLSRALGPGWIEIPNTKKIKPLRVTVRRHNDEDEEKRFCWGPPRDLKHLVWRAITDQAEGDAVSWIVCVVNPSTRPATKSQRAQHERLARRIGLDIVDITY